MSREARKWKRRSDWSTAVSTFTIISHGRIWAYIWSLSCIYPETNVAESEAHRLRVLSGYIHVNCIVQFTMYRLNLSFNFLGDLQIYTFLESLEPTEPEK